MPHLLPFQWKVEKQNFCFVAFPKLELFMGTQAV